MYTKDDLKEATEAYKDARKNIRDAISNNQKAMRRWQLNKSEENKLAYEATRKAHKKTIEDIQSIRNNYYVVKIGYETQQDN